MARLRLVESRGIPQTCAVRSIQFQTLGDGEPRQEEVRWSLEKTVAGHRDIVRTGIVGRVFVMGQEEDEGQGTVGSGEIGQLVPDDLDLGEVVAQAVCREERQERAVGSAALAVGQNFLLVPAGEEVPEMSLRAIVDPTRGFNGEGFPGFDRDLELGTLGGREIRAGGHFEGIDPALGEGAEDQG